MNDETPAVFDLADFSAVDEADLNIRHPVTGEPTGWIITFAGPAHPQTIALHDRLARQSLIEEKAQRQAQINGRKWKAEDETHEERQAKNIRQLADRIVRWSPIKINGETIPFSQQNAIKILSDKSKGFVAQQCVDFLGAEQTFLPKPATAS